MKRIALIGLIVLSQTRMVMAGGINTPAASTPDVVDAATISDIHDEVELLKVKLDEEKLKGEIKKAETDSPSTSDASLSLNPKDGHNINSILLNDGVVNQRPYVMGIIRMKNDTSAKINIGGHVSTVDVGDYVTIDSGRYIVKWIDDSSVVLSSGKKTIVLKAN